MTQSKWVRVGSVRRFDDMSDKTKFVRDIKGAAGDVDDAMLAYRYGDRSTRTLEEAYRDIVLYCCADVVQATLNLVAALGVEDFRPYLKACERRNREMGRITDGKAVDE
ncbi:MAG TPA: hypothetical protein IAA15_02590 [Candidatus Olsenella pullicola]|nr:hypothetical protein [Candidatus Olsenella pullicola]